MLSSPELPNPLLSTNEKLRTSPLGGLQNYAIVLFLITLVVAFILLGLLIANATKTPDYKLGSTLVQVVSPAPFSQVSGLVDLKMNMVAPEDPKNLKAYIRVNDSYAPEMTVTQVGKDVISLSGSFVADDVSTPTYIEVSVYNAADSHPILVSTTRVPLTIIKKE